MMSVKEYAQDTNCSIAEILKKCEELGIDVDDPLLMKLKPILFNETYQLFAIFILIFILGITAFKYFSLFLFGFIFFVAGFCCGSSKSGGTSNLIFLFSHGLTGLILMVAGMINETFKLYLDNSSYFAILIAAAIFFIFGFFNIIFITKVLPSLTIIT